MLAAPPVGSTQVQQAASRALDSNWLASNIGFGATSSGSGVCVPVCVCVCVVVLGQTLNSLIG